MKRHRSSHGNAQAAYDKTYTYVSGLRGHSRRDLGSEYLTDRIRERMDPESVAAVADAIEDAIEDAEES